MTTESQRVLVLNSSDIKLLLPMRDCIEVMADALADLTRGAFLQPLRMVVRPPEARGVMAMMPAYRQRPQTAYGLKAICFFYGNAAFNKDAHQLAIVGSGGQARMHLRAFSEVREIKRARVVSPNPDHPKQLAEEMRDELPFPVEPMTSVEDALKHADLIVTATRAREPVIRREWIADGAHVTGIGTYSAESREIDSATMAAARIFVDRRESALTEAGDFILPLKEGLLTE